MASESSFLSQTLQSITTTKMREQDKRRKAFEASKSEVLKSVTSAANDRARLEVLLTGFKDLSSSNKGVFYVDEDHVLNLRFADLENWSWQADEGMYYEPRRQLNGKYRIMMDMDILQAIFLYYIAVSWCGHMKSVFARLANDSKFWRGAKEMTKVDKGRHCFFTGSELPYGVNNKKMHTFCKTFFMSSMPSSLTDGGDPYGEDKDAQAAADETKTGLGMRQMFLRQLATDMIISRSLHGKVAVVQSDLQWYATGLPHSTLYAVLRFWGVPNDWIQLFKKYAEAPLRMTAMPGEDVRTRKRGIPITDAFETLFGECVLFCMDVAVNRLSSMTLIKFHDDLFLSGEPTQCANAWQVIEGFVNVLGLDINTSKTGSVYISDDGRDNAVAAKFPKGPVCMGMLQLTDEGGWASDQKQVAAHVRQLQKQLGQCNSVISWIQTWNACMGRFFQDTFGKPANCFGQAHVDAILETHANMQRQLFNSHGGSVTQYLREQILERFGVEKVPDSFFFLPEEFGGLGVKNPFIPFFVLKDQLLKNPLDRMADFRKDEKRAYKEASEAFAALSDSEKQRRLKAGLGESPKHAPVLEEGFFPFEEFTSHRESYSHHLYRAFCELMLKPSVQDVHLAKEVGPWFEELSHTHRTGWYNLSSEDK